MAQRYATSFVWHLSCDKKQLYFRPLSRLKVGRVMPR